MITTITAKLTSKTPRYPSGEMPLKVEEVDAEWILSMKYVLGQNGHPSILATAKNGMDRNQSLARMILRRHNVAIDDGEYACRKNMDPTDLTHENLCVPPTVFQHHMRANDYHPSRTISLKEYLNVFSIHRPPMPVADPCFVPVINMDTAKQAYLIADADDEEWLTGMPVRFNESGFPMIQRDWDKWTPLMFELARRHGCTEMNDPVVFRLKKTEPLDVRKHFVAIVTKDRMATLA